jgi:hypothetical protein
MPAYATKTPKNFAGEYAAYRVFGPGRRTEAVGAACQAHEAKRLIEDLAAKTAPDEKACFVVLRRSKGCIVASVGLEHFSIN